jgi:hypothetical protein
MGCSTVLRGHLRTFLWELDRQDDERGVPLFVKREFQRFVRCGVLAHGSADDALEAAADHESGHTRCNGNFGLSFMFFAKASALQKKSAASHDHYGP